MRQVNASIHPTQLKIQGLCFNKSENTQGCFIPAVNLDAFDDDMILLEQAQKNSGKYCINLKNAKSVGFFPKNKEIFETEPQDDEICFSQADMDKLNEI